MPTPEVTYAFYRDEYGGEAIDPADWGWYAKRAAGYLAALSAKCAVTPLYEGAEQMAACAVAEEMHNAEVAAEAAGPVKSRSIGSVSVTYDATFGGAVDLTPKGQEAALLRAAKRHLNVYAGLR